MCHVQKLFRGSIKSCVQKWFAGPVKLSWVAIFCRIPPVPCVIGLEGPSSVMSRNDLEVPSIVVCRNVMKYPLVPCVEIFWRVNQCRV